MASSPGAVRYAWALVALAALVAGASLLASIASRLLLMLTAPTDAAMTYMFPAWVAFPVPGAHLGTHYRAWLYHDQRAQPACSASVLPVLYVPGNAGSFKQARSLGGELAQAAVDAGAQGVPAENCVRMPVVAVDLGEELSAFDARNAQLQSEFVAAAIAAVWQRLCAPADLPGPACSGMVLVGQSMGGVVARLALRRLAGSADAGDRSAAASARVLVTLATPHAAPPLDIFAPMRALYASLSATQTQARPYKDAWPVIASLSLGDRDVQVRPWMTAPPATPARLWVDTRVVAGAWSSVMHDAVWANQAARALSHALRCAAALLPAPDTGSMAAAMAPALQAHCPLGLADLPWEHMRREAEERGAPAVIAAAMDAALRGRPFRTRMVPHTPVEMPPISAHLMELDSVPDCGDTWQWPGPGSGELREDGRRWHVCRLGDAPGAILRTHAVAPGSSIVAYLARPHGCDEHLNAGVLGTATATCEPCAPGEVLSGPLCLTPASWIDAPRAAPGDWDAAAMSGQPLESLVRHNMTGGAVGASAVGVLMPPEGVEGVEELTVLFGVSEEQGWAADASLDALVPAGTVARPGTGLGRDGGGHGSEWRASVAVERLGPPLAAGHERRARGKGVGDAGLCGSSEVSAGPGVSLPCALTEVYRVSESKSKHGVISVAPSAEVLHRAPWAQWIPSRVVLSLLPVADGHPPPSCAPPALLLLATCGPDAPPGCRPEPLATARSRPEPSPWFAAAALALRALGWASFEQSKESLIVAALTARHFEVSSTKAAALTAFALQALEGLSDPALPKNHGNSNQSLLHTSRVVSVAVLQDRASGCAFTIAVQPAVGEALFQLLVDNASAALSALPWLCVAWGAARVMSHAQFTPMLHTGKADLSEAPSSGGSLATASDHDSEASHVMPGPSNLRASGTAARLGWAALSVLACVAVDPAVGMAVAVGRHAWVLRRVAWMGRSGVERGGQSSGGEKGEGGAPAWAMDRMVAALQGPALAWEVYQLARAALPAVSFGRFAANCVASGGPGRSALLREVLWVLFPSNRAAEGGALWAWLGYRGANAVWGCVVSAVALGMAVRPGDGHRAEKTKRKRL